MPTSRPSRAASWPSPTALRCSTSTTSASWSSSCRSTTLSTPGRRSRSPSRRRESGFARHHVSAVALVLDRRRVGIAFLGGYHLQAGRGKERRDVLGAKESGVEADRLLPPLVAMDDLVTDVESQ